MPEGALDTVHLQQCVQRWQAGDAQAADVLLRAANQRLEQMARKMLRGFPAVHASTETADVLQAFEISAMRVAAFELFHLCGQALHLFLQLLEAFDKARMGLACGFQEAALLAVGDKRSAIQMQPRDVESSHFSPSLERPILLLDKVRRQIIAERVKDAPGCVGLPEVALEFVAGVARIHPVFGLVHATLRAGLEVVHGQFCTHVVFADAAIAATELEAPS